MSFLPTTTHDKQRLPVECMSVDLQTDLLKHRRSAQRFLLTEIQAAGDTEIKWELRKISIVYAIDALAYKDFNTNKDTERIATFPGAQNRRTLSSTDYTCSTQKAAKWLVLFTKTSNLLAQSKDATWHQRWHFLPNGSA